MEIVNLAERNCDENLRWAICELIASKGDLESLSMKDKRFDPKHPAYLKFEVEMKIDGVEVNFSMILKMLMEQYEHQIKKAGIAFVQDKTQKFQNKLEEMIEDFKYELLEKPSGLE